jgi:hypothetical protein
MTHIFIFIMYPMLRNLHLVSNIVIPASALYFQIKTNNEMRELKEILLKKK